MNPNGRDKARTREDMLIAVYRLVHGRMVCHETKSAKKVCLQIFADLPTDNDIIKFYKDIDKNDYTYQSVFDVCRNGENLRKRFQDAKLAAKDKENFPHLSQIVERLNSLLPTMIEQHRSDRKFMENEIQKGRSYLHFRSDDEMEEYLQKHHKPL